MHSYIFAIAMFLSGCGTYEVSGDHIHRTDRVVHRPPVVQPEFIPHVEKFEVTYKVKVSMPIMWSVLDAPTMAVCISWNDGYHEIHVDSIKWPANFDGQEQIIIHELGHCVFGLAHDNEKIDKDGWIGIPRSIMFPFVFGTMPYYSIFRQYYYDELADKRTHG